MLLAYQAREQANSLWLQFVKKEENGNVIRKKFSELLTSFSLDFFSLFLLLHLTLDLKRDEENGIKTLHLLLKLGHLFKRQNNLCFGLVIHTTWTARRLRFSLFLLSPLLVFKHNWGFNGRSLISLRRVQLFVVSAHKLPLKLFCFFSFTAAASMQCDDCRVLSWVCERRSHETTEFLHFCFL